MNGWITLSTKITLLLTFISSMSLVIHISIPYFFRDMDMTLNTALALLYLVLICVQSASTHFTTHLNEAQKVVRSFILALTFAIPWFLIYANQA